MAKIKSEKKLILQYKQKGDKIYIFSAVNERKKKKERKEFEESS